MIALNESNLTEQSVRWLQYMLNELAVNHANLPRLTVDGIFGENTLEAVMTFQRDFFPPVTGVVNNAVWDAITAAYQKDQLINGALTPLRVLPGSRSSTLAGQISEQVRLAQAMLTSLSRVVSNFDGQGTDGSNTGGTLADLRIVQKLAGLPETGTLDRATWEFLSRLYHVFVTRGGQV